MVYPNGTLIDFSGTARQIRETFHTEIHRLVVNGARHVANMSDPKIPEALEPAIVGIASLNDFMPHAMLTPQSDFAISNGRQVVVPEDLATIYNLNPLFKSGISGRGQTIVVIESTDVFNLADWHNFRKVFGLATAYPFASFTQIHPSSGAINNCVPPGTNGADEEAILDAEWSSAAAPNANIVLASCLSTTTFGGLIAVQNLINMPAPPPIMSISYGSSESNLGAAQNAAYYYTYQQAVAEGVSIFVSSGDSGADTSDRTTRHPWNQRKRLCIYAL